MDDINKFIMGNPQWNMGLAMLQGESPDVGLQRAQQAQLYQAQQDRLANQEKIQQAMAGGLKNGITPELIAEIAQYDVDTALKMKAMYDEQQKEARRMQMLQGAFGGDGMQADKIAGYAAATGDTSMLPLATFMQGQENRREDISREERRRAEDKASKRDEELRKAGLAGFKLEADVAPPTAVVTDASGKALALSGYNSSKQTIMDLLDKYGDKEVFTPAEANEIKQAFADIRDYERSLGNTGVLNVGELPFLEEKYAPFNPLEMANRTISVEKLKKKAEDYFGNRESRLLGELKSLGYKKEGGKKKQSANVDLSTLSDAELEKMLMELPE